LTSASSKPAAYATKLDSLWPRPSSALSRSQYGEAARLLREADERLQAARQILLVGETFGAGNGVSLTPFVSLLPVSLEQVANCLEARR
jgi:hypothetical protein